MGLREFFESLKASETKLPHLIEIEDQNIQDDNPRERLGKITPEKDYFTVRVNEMFLGQDREWATAIEPMVVCLTSYQYGTTIIDNPFIVGRNLINSKLKEIPQGMVFRDTGVAGIHPFPGGKLTVAMVLCQNEIKNYLKDSLEFIENVSGVLGENIRLLVGNYVQIANVVVNGIDKLLNSNQVVPLFGFRREFYSDLGDEVKGGYFAIIGQTKIDIKPKNLFVKGNQLYYGEAMDTAVEFYKQFKQPDYILFSINRSEKRTDIKTLPVTKGYNKILDELKSVAEVTQEHKDKIKSMLRVLNIEMRQSPDLTSDQARILMEQYVNEVRELIEPKFNFGTTSQLPEDEWSNLDRSIASL